MADYFDMLAAELAGVSYSKATHRRKLVGLLSNRSEQSVEFKHANVSAVLIELGFPYISGYKPRSNYQQLLYEVIAERLATSQPLLNVAAADADLPMVVPEVDDILSVLVAPPASSSSERAAKEPRSFRPSFAVSEAQSPRYHLYRLFSFRVGPQMFMVNGALSQTCRLSASTYSATVQ